MGLPKKNKIKKVKDFKEVYKKGYAVSGSFLFMKVKKTKVDELRIGIVVPAKIYKKAVQRSRIKRIIRESLKKIKEYKTLKNIDLVIGVRKKTEEDILKEELTKLLDKARIII